MSENKERPPFVPLTQDQFNVVFSQMLAGLRNRDVSSPSIETSSDEEEDEKAVDAHVDSSVEASSSPRATQEENDASTRALLHLLESHKILCNAVYHQILQRR